MKKLLCICAVVLMLCGLSVAASAAGTEMVTVKTSVADPVPGTLVEISIAITGAEPVTSCDIMFAYDEAVFEMVSGGWLYSGGTFDGSRAQISFLEPQDINGTVFMLKLRVRPEANFGDTTVNCVVMVTDAEGKLLWYNQVTPAQITVRSEVCDHDFVNAPSEMYMKAEATCISPAEYYQSCSKCGAAGESVFTDGEPVPHLFEEIQEAEYLLQEATCTSELTYYLSCQTCGLASEETFIVGEKLPHVLVEVVDEAFLATPGDCKTPATYYLSCEACREMGTITFSGTETLPHDYRSVSTDTYLASAGDCQTHPTYYVSCSVCGEAGEEVFEVRGYGDHVLEFACDTICKVCGKTCRRDQDHTPAENMTGDAKGHWLPCDVCGEKLESGAHIPGPEPTPDVPQTCTVCGYVLKVHESHACTYEDVWVYDEEGHWHECKECKGKADQSDHIWAEPEPGQSFVGCEVCDATQIVETEPTEPPTAPPTTQPTDPHPSVTQPSATQPTVAGGNGSNDKGIRTLVIVLGILLSVSLIGNGVLAYFVITLYRERRTNR